MANSSIDTVITDTPYGLGKTPDIVEVMQHWLNDEHYDMGKGFMSKSWDVVPGPAVWKELYRVVKPGGTLLAFGGTRTADLLSIAIRMGGWERFDEIAYLHGGLPPVIEWLYGSGFPKSMDIGKQLDKMAGAEREVVGDNPNRVGRHYQTNHDGWKRPWQLDTSADAFKITAPATEAAQQWDGWGTALKPAHEPILCFRKPTDGTFAQNALEHGVAGLNIEDCRVPISDGATMARNNKPGDNGWKNSSGGKNSAALNGEPSGRWPANVIHDGSDGVVAGFPVTNQNGYRHNKSTKKNQHGNTCYGKYKDVFEVGERGYDDTGSAARFFYCAKASRSERTCGGKVDNNHPTVKPLELLKYLCRLTATPMGGVVLDPFMGSGSVGIAALIEGRRFVGIDITSEYVEIARQRIEATLPKANDTHDDLPLFATT